MPCSQSTQAKAVLNRTTSYDLTQGLETTTVTHIQQTLIVDRKAAMENDEFCSEYCLLDPGSLWQKPSMQTCQWFNGMHA